MYEAQVYAQLQWVSPIAHIVHTYSCAWYIGFGVIPVHRSFMFKLIDEASYQKPFSKLLDGHHSPLIVHT